MSTGCPTRREGGKIGMGHPDVRGYEGRGPRWAGSKSGEAGPRDPRNERSCLPPTLVGSGPTACTVGKLRGGWSSPDPLGLGWGREGAGPVGQALGRKILSPGELSVHLDVGCCLGDEKRKGLRERQSREELAGRLGGGGQGVQRGESWGISCPGAGATGRLHGEREGEGG